LVVPIISAQPMPPPVSAGPLGLRAHAFGVWIPLATICSHVLDEKTRKPVSRAAEKQEQSALRETERTNGPLSESRIGRVFILNVGPRSDGRCRLVEQATVYLKAGCSAEVDPSDL
jgi:hypothetical protein